MNAIQSRTMQKNLEVLDFLSKCGALFGYIIIGLMGKFGFDIVTKKKITFWYAFGTGCMACFSGFITWQCIKDNPKLNPGVYLPIASLISRDILLFLTMIDWQGVLKLVTRKSTKTK